MKIVQNNIDIILETLKKRDSSNRLDVTKIVSQVIDNIKKRGNNALFEYTQQFDNVLLDENTIEISEDEYKNALENIDEKLLKSIEKAAFNIKSYHEKQRMNSWFDTKEDGTILGQKITPLSRVGIYVPGGTAPLYSSVLMNAIPAKVAGVKEIIMCTPPQASLAGTINNEMIVAARIAGVDRIFKVGGSQAIAAMAYGTKSIPTVDKIVGPGNIFVATAKKLVYGTCDIDMIAGPSEVLIIADDSAKPEFIAADLLSQAEHDKLASAILITNSKTLAQNVEKEIRNQLKALPRMEIAKQSIEDFGFICLVNSIEEAVNLSNKIAPEHLEVYTKDPFELLASIENAGAIFLGEYSPEPMGDYFAGPNHVLPTNGTARFYSPLNTHDFIKKSSVIYYTKNGFLKDAEDVIRLAENEKLEAHANSARIRKNQED